MRHECSRTATVSVVLLLLLSSVFSTLLVLPSVSAPASSPSIALTDTYGNPKSSGMWDDELMITGSGFTPGGTVTIQVAGTTVTTTTNHARFIGKDSLWDPAPTSGSPRPQADADGNFKTIIQLGDLPGGSTSIVAIDDSSDLQASQPFTITPSLVYMTDSATSGFPTQTVTVRIAAHGFAADETVSFTGFPFTAPLPSCTTEDSSTIGSTTFPGAGACNSSGNLTVYITPGGAQEITATGATSRYTASISFYVNTAVAFYNSQTGPMTFSTTQPLSVFLEGYGFSPGIINPDTITIDGVVTTHGPATIADNGTFGTEAGGRLAVTSASTLPLGSASVVVAGITFSYESGNIMYISDTTTSTEAWGAPLIISSSTSKGVAAFDSPSYLPALSGSTTTAIFGADFTPNAAVTITPPTAAGFTAPVFFIFAGVGPGGTSPGTQGLSGVGKADNNGAFFALASTNSPGRAVCPKCTGLTEEPYTVSGYTFTIAQGRQVAVTNPTFTIIPWIDLSGSSGAGVGAPTGNDDSTATITVDYKTSISTGIAAGPDCPCTTDAYLRVHGFTSGATVSLSFAGQPTSPTTIALGPGGFGSANIPDLIDVAEGTYSIVATDNAPTPVSSTYGGAISVVPRVDFSASGNALTLDSGGQGQVTQMVTGMTGAAGYGVHGLLASTAYQVVWGIGSAPLVIGTFFTTSNGGIAMPGAALTIPIGSTGIHILQIQQTSTNVDALFDVTLGDIASHGPFTDGSAAVFGQYGDSIFSFSTALAVSPTVAKVGSKVTVSGSGLKPSTQYLLTLGTTPGARGAMEQIYADFNSSSSGSIPSGTSFKFPPLPTGNGPGQTTTCGSATYFEQSAIYYIHASTLAEYPSEQDAQGSVSLAASANLNVTTTQAGSPVALVAAGLGAGCNYGIVFNYQANSAATGFTGTTVNDFVATSVGSTPAGGVAFSVPSGVSQGSYAVQLVRTGGPPLGVLSNPVTVTIGPSCASTDCFVAVSEPAQIRLGGLPAIKASYNNTSTGQVTGVVYGVVRNTLGQPVFFATATIAPGASQQATAYLVLSGLSSGSYTASMFVVTPDGVAISVTSTIPVSF